MLPKLFAGLFAMLSLISFLMAVDTLMFMILGYLFGIIFVIFYEEAAMNSKKKETKTNV